MTRGFVVAGLVFSLTSVRPGPTRNALHGTGLASGPVTSLLASTDGVDVELQHGSLLVTPLAAGRVHNDPGCNAGGDDCFRWEVFAQSLAPGALSMPVRVGYELDAGVQQFNARMLVAADLAPQAPDRAPSPDRLAFTVAARSR